MSTLTSTLTQTVLPVRRPGWAPWALALLLHLLLWWSWRQAAVLEPLAPVRAYPPMVWLRQPAPLPRPAPATAAADAAARGSASDQPHRRAGAAPAAPSRTTRAVLTPSPDRTSAGPPALTAGQVPGRAPVQTPAQARGQAPGPPTVQPTVQPGAGARTAFGADGAVPEAAGQGASAPARPLLLDTPATRQALRQMARQPLLVERAADATGIALPAGAERRAQAASAAGKGDCVKGEYFGAGAGLLSTPFLIVAAARGQCSSH
jgi:hypothetical protein